MTDEEIDKLEAGRELDLLVAQFVMGFTEAGAVTLSASPRLRP